MLTIVPGNFNECQKYWFCELLTLLVSSHSILLTKCMVYMWCTCKTTSFLDHVSFGIIWYTKQDWDYYFGVSFIETVTILILMICTYFTLSFHLQERKQKEQQKAQKKKKKDGRPGTSESGCKLSEFPMSSNNPSLPQFVETCVEFIDNEGEYRG